MTRLLKLHFGLIVLFSIYFLRFIFVAFFYKVKKNLFVGIFSYLLRLIILFFLLYSLFIHYLFGELLWASTDFFVNYVLKIFYCLSKTSKNIYQEEEDNKLVDDDVDNEDVN